MLEELLRWMENDDYKLQKDVEKLIVSDNL